MKQAITQYVMVALMVVGAYLIGTYKTKSDMLEKGVGQTPAAAVADSQQPPAPATISQEQLEGLFKEGNLVLGNKDAKLLIAEFSDPSCPYCHIAGGKNPELNNQVGAQFKLVSDGGSYVPAVPEIKKLVDEGKARFVYLYTPGHGNGELATKALYCANEKGKFWEVHDLMMTSKGYDLINDTVKNDVANAKILADFLAPSFASNEMQKCLESDKYNYHITDDPKAVAAIGQFGTPTFAFNTYLFEGAQPYDQGMSAIVDSVLK